MTEEPKSTSLYSTHGGANKEYHAYIRDKDGGWTVDYAHGGRGKALTTGTKTETPVDYAKALKIFERLVNEKRNGKSHYTEGEAGTEYESITDRKELFGVFPQEPTAIQRSAMEALITDDRFGFQLKANGENRLLNINPDRCFGGNKKGQVVSIPTQWAVEFRALGSFIANGEHVGDRFLAFDLLEYEGIDLRGWPQRRRYAKLLEMYDFMNDVANVTPSFGVIKCVYTAAEKQELMRHTEEARLEGIVAKNAHAVYSQGRGPDSLKFVFREVSTCIVMAINIQRSVRVGLLNAKGELVSCGNVTIPSNKPVPAIDDLIDVQYMYYNGSAFEISVYDPDNKSPRSDVDRQECTFDQITRFKPDEQDVDPQDYLRRQYA